MPTKKRSMAHRSMLTVGLALLLVLAACGGGDDASSDDGATEASAGGADAGRTSNDAGVDQDGFVTVEGMTFAFTYDNNGRCGADGGNGSVVSFGNLLDDPTRQVTFTYGLADETDSGEPIMQVIVMAEGGGTQLYYSAVGFGGKTIGSIDSVTRDGNTVRIEGQLQRVVDQILVPFEAEATCDQ